MADIPSWVTSAGAIAAAVGGVGGLAGIAALVNARALKAKTMAEADKVDAEADKVGADAAAQLTEVALRLVDPLSKELDSLRAEHARTQSRVGQLESDARTQHMLLVEHSVWDHLALARMKDAGVDLPPVPPLFPAVRPPADSVQSTT